MLFVRAVVVLSILVICPLAARAQIVNVQGALAKAPAEDGVTGQVELKVNWREGNNPIIDLGAAGNLIVRRGRVLGLAVARGNYGRSQGLTLTKKSFEHLRARMTIDCRWRWEAFAQHEFDQFRRLSLRALAGTGPALQIVDAKSFALLAGAAYVLEYERLDHREGTVDAGERAVSHRGSFYVTGREAVGAGVEIVETVYAQPKITRPSDVRLLAELAVVSKLSSRVALRNALTAAYDATPPDGVKRYDTALEVAVVVTF
jgi:hypothetical protein